MNESADKGQRVSSHFVDRAEGPCANKSAIGEDQASFKYESSFQEPSGFVQPTAA